jgi:hypothetical protein
MCQYDWLSVVMYTPGIRDFNTEEKIWDEQQEDSEVLSSEENKIP